MLGRPQGGIEIQGCSINETLPVSKDADVYKSCTYISYDSVDAIANLEHLTHTNDSIIEAYEEETEA